MATPEHVERDNAWDTTARELRKTLDAIPFTTTQRRTIDYLIDNLHISFMEANKIATEWEDGP